MADITRTKAEISLVNPLKAKIKTFTAAVDIEAGQPVYIDANGKVNLSDANGSGTDKYRGIALESVKAGQAVDAAYEGELAGYTLSGAYDSLVYVSNSVGELADAAGGTSLVVGRVYPMNDPDHAKVLHLTGISG